MSDLDTQLRARIDAFVTELMGLVRSAALESLGLALGRSAKVEARPAASTDVAAVPTRSAMRTARKGAKRDPKVLEQTVESLAAYVWAHPGGRIEDIAKGLAVPSNDLKLPVKKLLAGRRITKSGVKRATLYFPGRAPKTK